MCGIIGAAGAVGFKEEKMVKVMLQLDTIRGPHSTGLFGLHSDGNTEIIKKVGTPWELSSYRIWGEFWKKQFNVLIGHNRYATSGNITDGTAHPFNYDHISGVHNGTLKNDWKSKLDKGYTFDVDSECLYHHLAANGVDDTVKKLNGAFALVWYDQAEQTLNMTRNNERTLYFCHSEDHKTIFWASEDWMIIAAAAKADVEIGEVHLLKEHILYSIKVEPQPNTKRGFLVGDVRDLEQYVAPTWGNNRKKYQPSTHTGNTSGNTTNTSGNNSTKSSGNVVPLKNKVLSTELAELIGTEVKFTADGLDVDNRCNMEYVDCTPVGSCPVSEVRYYYSPANEDSAITLADTDAVYKATVRAFRITETSAYLTIDPRSLEVYVSGSEELAEVKN